MRRLVFILLLVCVNAGALLLLAPNTANAILQRVDIDPNIRELLGWFFFGGGQVLLLLLFSSTIACLRSSERAYRTLQQQYDDVVRLRDALAKREACYAKGPKWMAVRLVRLREKLRVAESMREVCLRKSHRQDIEIAELRKFRSYLADADEYDDSDDRRNEVLLREVTQLRERMEYMVDPTSHQEHLAQYYELKGRLAALQEQPQQPTKDLRQVLEAAVHDDMVTDQAVS